MAGMDTLIDDLDAFDRHLSRRRFIKLCVAALVLPQTALAFGESASLAKAEYEFLRKVALTLIPYEVIISTGIDPMVNIEKLISNGGAEQRAKVARLVAVAQRSAFLYGGDKIAIRARTSRFVLVQKLAKALSSLCLVAFWADERALALITTPGAVK
ncbi:MAG: hypothetical protein AB1489_36525 [Acidobacteriota bacterium]